MPGRNFDSDQYRFGFNGKEMDNEVSGNGNQYDYGFRIYNPRLGRFLSVDPLTKDYPWYTPYQFAGNKPINSIDLEGLEDIEVHDINKDEKTAIVTIHYTDLVITFGMGTVNENMQGRIKSVFFNSNYEKLWEKGSQTLQLKSLPQNGEELQMATPEDIEKNEFWNISVQFDVDIQVKDDFSYSDWANLRMSEEPGAFNKYGVVVEPDEKIKISESLWEDFGVKGAAEVGEPYTFLRPGYSGDIGEGSYSVISHELGHKWGLTHEKGDYSQKGLMSNWKTAPTKQNVIDVININNDKIRNSDENNP